MRGALLALAVAACGATPEPRWTEQVDGVVMLGLDGSVVVRDVGELGRRARDGSTVPLPGVPAAATLIGIDERGRLVAWDKGTSTLLRYAEDGSPGTPSMLAGETLVTADVDGAGDIVVLTVDAAGRQWLQLIDGWRRMQDPPVDLAWVAPGPVVYTYTRATLMGQRLDAAGQVEWSAPGGPMTIWDHRGGGVLVSPDELQKFDVERLDFYRSHDWQRRQVRTPLGLAIASDGTTLLAGSDGEVERIDDHGVTLSTTAVDNPTVLGGDAVGFYTSDGRTLSRYE